MCCSFEDRERKKDLEDQILFCKSDLSMLRQDQEKERSELKRLQDERQNLYNTIKRQAECAAIAQVQDRISELENEELEKKSAVEKVSAELDMLNSSSNTLQKKYAKMKTLFESYQSANKRYIKEGESHLDESFLKNLAPTIEIDLQCMNIRQLRGLYNQNKTLIQDCLKRYEGRYTTKTNAALYKLMTIALEAELQNILYSISFGKLESLIDSVKTMSAKCLAIATDGNQSIAPTIKKFIGEIEHLFIEAVK